ncbi:MAG: cytochrome c3 family protein [Chloroflexota bacterium]
MPEPTNPPAHQRGLVHNPTTYVGAILAIASAIIVVALIVIHINSSTQSPYVGIFAFLVLPAFVVLGLLLIPIGMWFENRRRRRYAASETEAPPPFPHIDLNQPRHQSYFGVFMVGTVLALGLLGTAAYQAYTFMETTTFCGETCHAVMQPERVAYLDSPHARVTCVSCHIGPGASWWVRSKASGVGQVFAVVLNNYPRPIPTPLENLRPARDTCETCHWPEQFYGDRIVSHTRYQTDEGNTAQQTSLIVKTGGASAHAGLSTGIHWHVDPRNEVLYVATDDKRQEIPWVGWRQPDGTLIEYTSTDKPISADELQSHERRVMDCIDCHNRPTHIFYSPDAAIDRELAAGRIDPTLPFAKKNAVELIQRQYPSQEEARRAIAADWEAMYRDSQPQVYAAKAAAVKGSATAVADAYTRNIFPQMNVTWGTYHSNIGHQEWPGCFRCHDGKHVSSTGRAIRNDCTLCHSRPQVGEVTGIAVAPATQPGAQPQATPAPQATAAPAQPTAQTKPQATTQATAQATAQATTAAPTKPAAGTPPPAASPATKTANLHQFAAHAGTGCNTCHSGTPGGPPPPERATCTAACHADRVNHNPGPPCQTCHSFRG